MAGHFDEVDPEQCAHYALFLSKITRTQADLLFWCLFCFTISLLTVASHMYTKFVALLPPSSHAMALTGSRAAINPSREVRKSCLLISLTCFLLALPAISLSALSGLTIEFCHAEDLMAFYWAFWTLIQVGGGVAIGGVVLNQCYGLRNMKQPPWNVALGTPVLVIAALGHAAEVGGRGLWKRMSRRDLRNTDGEREMEDLERAETETRRGSEESVIETGKRVAEEIEGGSRGRIRTDNPAEKEKTTRSISRAYVHSRALCCSYTDESSSTFVNSRALSPDSQPATRSSSEDSAASSSKGDKRRSREIRFADEAVQTSDSRRSSS